MNKFSTKFKIKITGLNLHHALTYFEREKFSVSDICRVDNKILTCTLYKADFKKFKKSPLYKTYKVKIVAKLGTDNLLNKLVYKIGLFIGIAICLVTTLNLTNKIYSVTLNTTGHTCENMKDCIYSDTNKEKINAILKENNIYVGGYLSNIPSNSELEHLLMKEFKQISGVSITRNGVHVCVDILEAKLLSPATTTNLIAQESGIVVSLDVTLGNAKVKPGDVVLKGDVLVAPQNNNKVVANAVIRTFYHEAVIYNEVQTKYVRTGSTITQNNLILFNLNLNSSAKNTFKLYESNTHSRYAFLNILLPVKINQTTYYELKKEETIIPFSEVENSLKAELQTKTTWLIPSNAQIKNTTYTTHQEGSRTRLDCYIETYLTLTKT